MIPGIGFSEIVLISVLILLFFGSKELPNFIREIAKLLAQLRVYSNRIRSEFDNATRQIQDAANPPGIQLNPQTELRKKYKTIRDEKPEIERAQHSAAIVENVRALKEYKDALAVMVYVSVGSEVSTRNLIDLMLTDGKQVVVPFCKTGGSELGIAKITDPATQLNIGTFGIPEPVEAIRNNFFKSDLSLVICPGFAFDRLAGRLGRGRDYFENFMGELKGKVPIVGLAFECQILDESLWFGYDLREVRMDQIVTEKGPLLDPK